MGRVINVTTASDAENGDTRNVDALLAEPGRDGISLREAIAAANNTRHPETIEFAPELKDAVINVGSSRKEGLVLTGGWLIINGDINGDGNPDITLDGSLGREGTSLSVGLTAASSHNTINGLNIVAFPEAGIVLTSCYTRPCTERVVAGNKVLRNVISGSRHFGIQLRQPGHLDSDMGWRDTLIAGNIIRDIGNIPIYLVAGFGGGSRNHIVNTTIAANRLMGGSVGIDVVAGDTASDWFGHAPSVRERTPVRYSDHNVIQNTIISGNIIEAATFYGIAIEAANFGNRNNVVECTKVVGNSITGTQWRALAIFGGTESGSRPTTDNRVSDVEIAQNTIADADVGIVLGAANKFGEYSGAAISTNQLEDILVTDNLAKGYRTAGLVVWAGMTCSSTYDVSNNVVKRLTIRWNQLIAQVRNGTTGMQLMAGWGCWGLASSNRVEDVSISDNVPSGNDVAIRLIGGTGSSARDNRVMRTVLQNNTLGGNTESLRITENDGGAINNAVEVSMP